MATMIRVTTPRAQMAWDVLEAAKANGDDHVATICRRVREAWLLGKRVSSADIAIVEEFWS